MSKLGERKVYNRVISNLVLGLILVSTAVGIIFTEYLSDIETRVKSAFSMFIDYKLKSNEYLCIAPVKDEEQEYKSLCNGAKLASFLAKKDNGLRIQLTNMEYKFNDEQIISYIEKSNVIGIIGPDIYNYNSELASYIKSKNIPIISPLDHGFSEDMVAYDYQMYLGLDMYSLVRSILTYARNALEVDNIVYVGIHDHFSNIQKGMLKESYSDFGMQQIGDFEIPKNMDEKELTRLVRAISGKVYDSKNVLIYMSTTPEIAFQIENMLRKNRIHVPIILNGRNTVEIIEGFAKIGEQVVEQEPTEDFGNDGEIQFRRASNVTKLYVPEPFDYDAAGQKSDYFRLHYAKIYGNSPSRTAAYGFDSINYFNQLINKELDQVNHGNHVSDFSMILQSAIQHSKNARHSHSGVTGRILMTNGLNRNDSFLMKRFERGKLDIPYIQTTYNNNDSYSWDHKEKRGSNNEYHHWIDKYAKNICLARHVVKKISMVEGDSSLVSFEVDYYLSSKYPLRMKDLAIKNTNNPYTIEMTDFLRDYNGVYHMKFTAIGSISRSQIKEDTISDKIQLQIELVNKSEKQNKWMFIIGDEFVGLDSAAIPALDLFPNAENRFNDSSGRIDVVHKSPEFNQLGLRTDEIYSTYIVDASFISTRPRVFLYTSRKLSSTGTPTAIIILSSFFVLLIMCPVFRKYRIYPLTFALNIYLVLSLLACIAMRSEEISSRSNIVQTIQVFIAMVPLFIQLKYGLPFLKRVFSISFGRELSSIYSFIFGIFLILFNLILTANLIFSISLTALLAYSSVLTIVLGMALRNLIMDTFAGILISVDRAFSPSDWVAVTNRFVGTAEGKVVKMRWRSVQLETRSKNLINIPNNLVVASCLKNYCQPSSITRIRIPIEIDSQHSVQSVLNVFSKIDNQELVKVELENPKIIVNGIERFAVKYDAFVYYDIRQFGPDDARTRFLMVLTPLFRSQNIEFSIEKLKLVEDFDSASVA